MLFAGLAHAYAQHQIGIIAQSRFHIQLHHGGSIVGIHVGQADHLRHGTEGAAVGLNIVGRRCGLKNHHRLASQLFLGSCQLAFQIIEPLQNSLARLAVLAESIDQHFRLALDGIIRHGVTGVHIIHGDACFRQLCTIGIGRGIAQQHQIRLHGYHGFNIKGGAMTHGQQLRLRRQILRPGDHGAGRHGNHVNAQFVQGQHRGS